MRPTGEKQPKPMFQKTRTGHWKIPAEHMRHFETPVQFFKREWNSVFKPESHGWQATPKTKKILEDAGTNLNKIDRIDDLGTFNEGPYADKQRDCFNQNYYRLGSLLLKLKTIKHALGKHATGIGKKEYEQALDELTHQAQTLLRQTRILQHEIEEDHWSE